MQRFARTWEITFLEFRHKVVENNVYVSALCACLHVCMSQYSQFFQELLYYDFNFITTFF